MDALHESKSNPVQSCILPKAIFFLWFFFLPKFSLFIAFSVTDFVFFLVVHVMCTSTTYFRHGFSDWSYFVFLLIHVMCTPTTIFQAWIFSLIAFCILVDSRNVNCNYNFSGMNFLIYCCLYFVDPYQVHLFSSYFLVQIGVFILVNSY